MGHLCFLYLIGSVQKMADQNIAISGFSKGFDFEHTLLILIYQSLFSPEMPNDKSCCETGIFPAHNCNTTSVGPESSRKIKSLLLSKL